MTSDNGLRRRREEALRARVGAAHARQVELISDLVAACASEERAPVAAVLRQFEAQAGILAIAIAEFIGDPALVDHALDDYLTRDAKNPARRERRN